MAQEKFQLTKEGIAKLKEELDNLIKVERPQVIEQLKAARAQGDLSENADYDAARKEQARIESRIQEINIILENADRIDTVSPKNTKAVSVGASVEILDLSENEKETYKIVGTVESDPMNGMISNKSPLGEALMGHAVNDVVTVKARVEYQVKILKIEFGK